MKFNNRDNEEITLPDGRTIWISRSSTVVITLWCLVNKTPYLLIGQRGETCPDEIGKWNLPCGYLDWDETLSEAAEREVWEETGVDLRSIQRNEVAIVISLMDQPWMVNSHISGRKGSKQNVSHHYALVYKADELPATSMDYCEPGEVADIKWIKTDEIDDYDYAFQHSRVIREFLERHQSEFV